jgi:pimeloyl-ACP methyl ester carboxylesterase
MVERQPQTIDANARAPLNERRLTLSHGVEIAYLDNELQNEKPPLLLLHGIFDNKATWKPLSRHLHNRRIIAPDLVGHGSSSKNRLDHLPATARYSPDMQVEFVRDFIKALDLESFVLGGNSLGGGIALRLYLRFADIATKVRGLVLVAAAGYPQELPGHVQEMGGWIGSLLQKKIALKLAHGLGLMRLSTRITFRRCFYAAHKIPADLVNEALAALKTPDAFYAYQQSALNIVPPDIDEFHREFGRIACPALVFWGRQDRILHPLAARLFAAELPDAELHLFDQCGHAPHIEQVDETARLLTDWLQRRTDK